MTEPADHVLESGTYSSRQFKALGTSAFVATTRPDAITAAKALLCEELNDIDLACSRFRPDSELSRVQSAHGHMVVVSQLLADTVAVALRVAEQTNGAVDPTVGACLIGLGYDRDFEELSEDTASRPMKVEPSRGWTSIELDARHRMLRIPEGVVLDLGATAKAFAADHAASRIAEVTGSGVLVNLGGDISVEGAPEEGWAIGIALDCATSPLDAEVVVSIGKGGLASSGTMVRTWRQGDRQVHHIIDPKTGDSAVTCWQLVSVAARTCVDANAASTAAIVWGDSAIERLTAFGMPCRLVHNDGSVITINGWPTDSKGLRGPHGKAA